MNLDAVNLRALFLELTVRMKGAFLQKFSQLTEEDYLLSWRIPGENLRLLICLRPGESRLHLVGTRPQSAVPSSFSMLVRKHLQGQRLEGLRQEGLERVMRFFFAPDRPELVLELMGQQNNLLLLSPQGRIAGVHRTGHDERALRVGREYVPPAPPPLPWAHQVSGEELVRLLCATPGDLSREAPRHVFGLPGFYLADAAQDLPGSWDRFWSQLEDPAGYRPGITAGGTLTFRAPPGSTVFASMQQAAEALWQQASRLPGFEQRRADISRRLGRRLDKARRKLEKRRRDRENAGQADLLKHRADLLLANLGEVPAGASEVELPDWTPGAPSVRLKLDPRLTPSENAQSLYTRYRKLKRAASILKEQVSAAADELAMLEEVEMSLALAEMPEELDEIGRILAPAKKGRRAPQAPASGPRRFRFGAFELLVGRNPGQNDQLTTRVAARDDLWFHAREIPGSHVILRTAGRSPADDAVLAAAVLAARYSRASGSTAVPISYTEVRHVRKPAGSPPGKVIYRHEKTIMVDPRAMVTGLEAQS